MSDLPAPGGRDLERTLGRLLTPDLGEVGPVMRLVDLAAFRRAQQHIALEIIEQGKQVGCGEHFYLPGPCRLWALSRRTNKPEPKPGGVERRQQYAGRIRDASIKAQLADNGVTAQRLLIDDSHRPEQGERDRKVVMRSLFRQISGREVDRDAFGRQCETHRGDCSTHTLAAFANGLVRQPDNNESGNTGRDLALNFNAARLKPEIRYRLISCYHASYPLHVAERARAH